MIRHCERCERTFVTHPSRVRIGEGRFCSRACGNASRRGSGTPLVVRFWAKVDRSAVAGCWLWTGPPSHKGYGQIPDEHRRNRYAHRLALEWAMGVPLPPGSQTGHTCDNRLCVRNDEPGVYEVGGVLLPRRGHLFLCTTEQNTADMVAKGRQGWTLQAGALNGRSKLADAQVLAIRAEYARRVGQVADLARRYGVSPAAIRFIVTGRTWRHLLSAGTAS